MVTDTLLTKIAEFFYTKIFKPPPIRRMVNKAILLMLPHSVKYGNAIIVLNPSDPVISGALLFRVYERNELRFLVENLSHGDIFIDIGANVGLYTGLAMHLVGSDGMVLAFEPDPQSFHFLKQTINENLSGDVEAFNLAASNGDNLETLYISSENRGDNRFHNFKTASETLKVHTVSVDSILEKMAVQITSKRVFIKLDIQGSEGLALQGLRQSIRDASELTILMEFWPSGLRNMNTDPEQLLIEMEEAGLKLYELGQAGKLYEFNCKKDLINKLPGRKYTNIVGIKNPK